MDLISQNLTQDNMSKQRKITVRDKPSTKKKIVKKKKLLTVAEAK